MSLHAQWQSVKRGLLLPLLLSGCTTWTIQTAPPTEVISTRRLERVRVFSADSGDAIVDNPYIRGDSLIGILPHSSPPGEPLKVFAIPLARVEHLGVRHFDLGRTFALGLGGPGAVLFSGFLMGY